MLRNHKHEPEKLEKDNYDNMYKIIGIIDSHYIVQSPKGFKKVNISGTFKKILMMK